MPNDLRHQRQAWSSLLASTLAFTVCFMAWMMFGVIGLPIRDALNLSDTRFGLLMATPILAGALVRAPLGIWSERWGGRFTMTVLLLVCAPGIWLLSLATQYWQLLLAGLFVGLAGGAFAVGIPYVARWFAQGQQGMAMGVYGSGNVGAALNQLVAPTLVVAFGWQVVPQVYAVLILLVAVVFWWSSHEQPTRTAAPPTRLLDQLRLLRQPQVLRYCQYYAVVFGGFVGLALWLVQYYVGEYGMNIRTAALMAAFFALPGGLARGLGGWLADRYGPHPVTWGVLWVSWVCLFVLSYPPTSFTIHTTHGPQTFEWRLNVYVFTALLSVLGIAWAFGRASVFKYISQNHPDNLGAVSGLVGMAGGLGGFVLPIMFGVLMDWTGIRSSAFMLLYALVWLSLIWMYWADVRKAEMMGENLHNK